MRRRLLLTFSAELVNQPLVFQLVRRFDLELNILHASIDPEVQGKLLLEVQGSQTDLQLGVQWLRSRGVLVSELGRLLALDSQACVDCGACTAVCSPQALSLNSETWRLEFHEASCLACAACVAACPLGCIRLS